MALRLTEYIRRPDALDHQAAAQLRQALERFPYNHSARILLLQALHRLHDPAFDSELRRSAPLLPSRQAVFRLTEEAHYRQDPLRQRFETDGPTADTTQSLIDSFLDNLPPQPVSHRAAIDATQDYMGYLLQQTDEAADDADLPVDENGLIDQFLLRSKGRIRLSDDADDTPLNTKPSSFEPNKPEEQTSDDSDDGLTDETESVAPASEILTESLAHIYIKQGKFQQAIEIIRRLSLKYPKKNRYFADQIRFLEKLIINNQNK